MEGGKNLRRQRVTNLDRTMKKRIGGDDSNQSTMLWVRIFLRLFSECIRYD